MLRPYLAIIEEIRMTRKGDVFERQWVYISGSTYIAYNGIGEKRRLLKLAAAL
jgi:hypothetical protein